MARLAPDTMFGDLKVIAYAGVRSKRQRYECECLCGEHFIVYKEHLLSGRTTSCPDCARARDIAGTVSGNWEAVIRIGKGPTGGTLWQCRCTECGRGAFFDISDITHNNLPICTHGAEQEDE